MCIVYLYIVGMYCIAYYIIYCALRQGVCKTASLIFLTFEDDGQIGLSTVLDNKV